jgi:hypothetical protein
MLFVVVLVLALYDSIVGTYTGTCTAVEALICINFVDITL